MKSEILEQPAFEVHVGDRRFAVYADGRIEGFGDGAIIFNRIPALVHQAVVDAQKAEAA